MSAEGETQPTLAQEAASGESEVVAPLLPSTPPASTTPTTSVTRPRAMLRPYEIVWYVGAIVSQKGGWRDCRHGISACNIAGVYYVAILSFDTVVYVCTADARLDPAEFARCLHVLCVLHVPDLGSRWRAGGLAPASSCALRLEAILLQVPCVQTTARSSLPRMPSMCTANGSSLSMDWQLCRLRHVLALSQVHDRCRDRHYVPLDDDHVACV